MTQQKSTVRRLTRRRASVDSHFWEPFILSGYRDHGHHKALSPGRTMFSLHNETFNIWTHLTPGLLYLWMAIPPIQLMLELWSGIVTSFDPTLSMFLASSASCLLLSAAAHVRA